MPAATGLLERLWRRIVRRPPPSPTPSESRRRVALSVERHLRGLRAGDRPSPFSGAGLEAAQVRPYQDGESVRRVDWRVTARRGALHVRTYQEDRDLPVVVVLSHDEVRSPAYAGWPAATLDQTHQWIARAAVLAGHPTGLRGFGGQGGSWLPPTRGKRTLQRLLAAPFAPVPDTRDGRTLAEALDALLRHLPGEALVPMVSTFAFDPPSLDALKVPMTRLARRHRVVPIWVDPMDELPAAGLVSVAEPSGRRHVVDTASKRQRAEYEEATHRWREAVRGLLRRCGTRPLRLRPGDRVETRLAQYFSPRSRRLRRAGVWLGFLLATAVPAVAQDVLPGQIRVEHDTLVATPSLGTPVQRVTLIRTTPGGRLEVEDPAQIRGEIWDVLQVNVHPLDGDSTRWVATSQILPWWMGRQALPTLSLQLSDAAGLRRVQVDGARTEIVEPIPPATGPAVTWPDARGTTAWAWLRFIPWVLALAGAIPLLRPVVVRAADRIRSRPLVLEPVEPLPGDPRATLDQVMDRLRVWARSEYQAQPDGWTTQEWSRWGEALPEANRDRFRTVLALADEPRFRDGSVSAAAAQEAAGLLNGLIRSPESNP